MLSAIWSIPFGQYRKLPDLETADFAGSDFAQADQNSISLEAARWREEDSSFQTAAGKVLPLELFEESLLEFLSVLEFRSCFLDLRMV
jgi:hypothetical protein